MAGLAVVAALAACAPERLDRADGGAWNELEPGLELGAFAVDPARPSGGSIHVVRFDPARFELRLVNASAGDGERRSARQWSEREGLAAAINAGMYQEDYSTGVSLMRSADHVNNAHLTRHRAILMFDPVERSDPPVALVDLTCESYDDWKARYRGQLQSIRMVSCDGENVWSPGDRRFSTAAIGVDRAGRPLFVHVATPLPTSALIDRLLELPLDLDGLLYAEGGPQAQLWVDAGPMRLELVGELDAVTRATAGAWPVPNILGVRRIGDGR